MRTAHDGVTDRQTDRQRLLTSRRTAHDGVTDRQTDRQRLLTSRRADRQTDRHYLHPGGQHMME